MPLYKGNLCVLIAHLLVYVSDAMYIVCKGDSMLLIQFLQHQLLEPANENVSYQKKYTDKKAKTNYESNKVKKPYSISR